MRRKRADTTEELQMLPRHDGRTPAPPIRLIGLRYVTRTGRFVPCTEDDPRGTVRARFDAAGRSVEAVYPEGYPFDASGQVGWRITAGAMNEGISPTPAEVIAWFEEAAAKRRKSR